MVRPTTHYCYLTRYRWDSTTKEGEPFWVVPDFSHALAVIDLRPLPEQAISGGAGGYAFAMYDRPQVRGTYYLELGAVSYPTDFETLYLFDSQLTDWNSAMLGRGPSQRYLAAAIWEQLTSQSSITGQSGPKPIMPDANGETRLELPSLGWYRAERFDLFSSEVGQTQRAVLQENYRTIRTLCLDRNIPSRDPTAYLRYLGALRLKFQVLDSTWFIPPDLPYEGVLAPATTYSEDFNTGDSDTLGPNLSWTEISGDWDVVSAEASAQTAGGADLARADHDHSTDDHEVHLTITGDGGGIENGSVGPIARKDSTGTITFYHARLADTLCQIYKWVSGSATKLAETTVSPSLPDDVQVECNGSTIKSYFNSSEIDSITDVSVTGGLRGGMRAFEIPTVTPYGSSSLTTTSAVRSQSIVLG